MSLADLLRKHGPSAKFRRALEKQRNWPRDRWYREWERGLAKEVVAAFQEVYNKKEP